jgi:superfamily I DNA/RNA helicase
MVEDNALNESQEKAVITTEGPVLIVAGPGTGKTLTIACRIVYLINQGVRPENISAVTFTNRAAREMKERAGRLLGEVVSKVFIGTLHLLGLKIIRDTLSKGSCGQDNFVIYSRDEQINLLKGLVKGSGKKASAMAERISRIKNLIADMDDEVRPIYEVYQAELEKNSAFDFDDLVLKPVDILSNSNEILHQYRNTFKYIMVDEYQDINPAQYKLLRLITNDNLCAIGDSDQAIYAFRGADVGNFLNFERDFKGTKRLILTENYRSTGVILNASSALIKNNLKRIPKELNPIREKGIPVMVISVPDENAESEIIVRGIEERIGGTSHYQLYSGGFRKGDRVPLAKSYSFSDFAVIYRTNAQAKTIEEAFSASGIPYQVIGNRRKAITEVISKLRDYLTIHDTTSISIEEFLKIAFDDIRPDDRVAEFIKSLSTLYKELSLSISDFLNELSLLTPADDFDPRADVVTLMTLHMAKGLEFRVVFITGVEDGLTPYTITKGEVDIEEERRLLYVGMTRAKDELSLIHARSRFLYGQRLTQEPSPFIKEIPEEFLEFRFIPDRVIKKEKQMGLF